MTMPMISPSATRSGASPTLRPASRFVAQYRRGIDAVSGQVATLTRTSTATLTDSAGATVTVPHSRPRPEPRMFSGVTEIGLRVSTEDLTYPWAILPETGTFLIEGINLGTAQTSGMGLLYVGRDDQTGTRLAVRGTGTTFDVTFTNAGGLTSVATFGAVVSNGDAFQLLIHLDDDGTNQRVRIGGTDAGVPVTLSAYGTARARSATWGTGSVLRLNRLGSAGTQGNAWLRSVVYAPGILTVADLSGVL